MSCPGCECCAGAAAMREMLEEVVRTCDQVPTDPKMFSRKAAIALVMMRGGAAMALIGDAGRAIAERVPLWRELERRCRESWLARRDDVLDKLAALDNKGGAS